MIPRFVGGGMVKPIFSGMVSVNGLSGFVKTKLRGTNLHESVIGQVTINSKYELSEFDNV
jgi:hypothetical protein